MMLLVTPLTAAVATLLYLFLCVRVVALRRSRRVGIGDGGDPVLARAVRVHGNFAEYVPLALVLLGLMELAGLPQPWLWVLASVLVLARCLHAHGLGGSEGVSPGRFWGTALTWTYLLVAALLLVFYALAELMIGG